uniref:BTB domain-containing protein n=1 Tax=Panagrellus redivivus TaxID=6233 RepID=A0A7E4V491_PANRE
MDRVVLVEGDGFDALDAFFKAHYSFDMQPPKDYEFFYNALSTLVFDKKSAAKDNFLNDLKSTHDMFSIPELL